MQSQRAARNLGMWVLGIWKAGGGGGGGGEKMEEGAQPHHPPPVLVKLPMQRRLGSNRGGGHEKGLPSNQTLSSFKEPFAKHCHRHNRSQGWALFSLGHITCRLFLVPFGTLGSKSDQIKGVTITAGLKLHVLSPLLPWRGGGRTSIFHSCYRPGVSYNQQDSSNSRLKKTVCRWHH